MSDIVQLKVGGQIYTGWTAVSIDRELGAPSGSFSLSVTEQWPGSQATHRIPPGLPFQLAIDDTPLITGWTDDIDPSYDSTSHTVSIKGRDRTGDLVDCSAIVDGSGGWNGVSVMDIARVLLKPYGIAIKSSVAITDKVLAGHDIQMGESVWECLERALRLYGVTAMPDGLGNLLLTVPGAGPALAELKLGGAILSASGSLSGKDTFSDYYVLGQFPGGGDTYSDPRVSNGAFAHAKDPNVTRYRPLIVSVECNTVSQDFLPRRAKWEAAHRSGKARNCTIKVQGWRDAKGAIYEPNSMVRVEDDFLGLHESLLVSGVKLALDDGGKVTDLKCTRLSAFVPETLPYEDPYDNSGATK
jgi:prophage tail gpP-like protein